MRDSYILTSTAPSRSIRLQNFEAAFIFVENPTGSPVAVRIGGSDIPDSSTADHLVPPNGELLVPCHGAVFAFGFTDTTAVTSAAISNLLTRATVTLYDATEKLPSFGASGFLNLSLTELVSDSIYGDGGQSPVLDLSLYGGAVIFVTPDAGVAQGTLTVTTSSSVTMSNPRTVGVWGLWPGIPATLILPRTQRYLRLQFTNASIPGEGATSGHYTVRASLAELTQMTFIPGVQALSKTLSVSALGSQTFIFATRNLPAVSLGVNITSGTRAELVVYAGPTAAGPWRLVNFREQNVQGFYNSIYRSVGDLDLYTRVDVLELANVAMTGTVTASIRQAPDLTGILGAIYAALGDVGQPVNVNQSIYHELDTIRQASSGYLPFLSTINTALTVSIPAQLVTLHNDLGTVHNDLVSVNANLGGIGTGINTVNTNLGTIHNDLNTTIHSDLNTNLPPMLTILTNLYNALKQPAFYFVEQIVSSGAPGTWISGATNVWGAVPNGYLMQIVVWVDQTAGIRGVGNNVRLAFGTGAAPTFEFYRANELAQPPGPAGGGNTAVQLPTKQFFGTLSSGNVIPPGQSLTWLMCTTSATVTVTYEVWYRAIAP